MYILVKGNISVNNNAGAGAAEDNLDKKVKFKNCASFTNCISKIKNTQIYVKMFLLVCSVFIIQ